MGGAMPGAPSCSSTSRPSTAKTSTRPRPSTYTPPARPRRLPDSPHHPQPLRPLQRTGQVHRNTIIGTCRVIRPWNPTDGPSTGMGFDTAVQPAIYGIQRQWTAMRLLRGVVRTHKRRRPQGLIPNGMPLIGGTLEAKRPAFPLVTGRFVGLAGLEPAASSSGEDPRPPWQTAWYLPRSTRRSPPPRSSGRPRGPVALPFSCAGVGRQAHDH
jgi:hypothetical protein